MCADKDATLPEVFYGLYLFHAEITDADGLKKNPTFFREPRGNVPVLAQYYRRMEADLREAAEALDKAEPLVPDRCRLMYDAEDSSTRWFYHTARAHANFYESCILRDLIAELRAKESLTDEEREQAAELLDRWTEVLEDERANAEAALPLVQRDVRLDWYFGSDHTFPHAEEMITAKLDIIGQEISEYLPGIARELGLSE